MSRWLKWHGWFVWTSHSLPWRRSCTYEFVCWRKIIFLLLMSNVIFHRSRKTYCMDAQWFVIHFLCSPPLARALSRPHRGNCTARHMFYLELSCGEDQQKLWQPETKKWYPWPNNILHKWHCALYQYQCSHTDKHGHRTHNTKTEKSYDEKEAIRCRTTETRMSIHNYHSVGRY